MKYLVIAALLALLLLLVYSKIYPYLQVLKKIFGAARTMANAPHNRDQNRDQSGQTTANGGRKLIRCVSCGTWVPAERALGAGKGSLVYCSRDCIERAANSGKRKMAG